MIGGSSAPVSRPKRPGARRASAVPSLSQEDDDVHLSASPEDLKEQLQLPPKAPRRTSSAPQASQALDVDLDLDLPVDLTAVLQQNALKWSTRGRSPSELNRGLVAAAKSEVPEYFSEPAMQNTSDGSGNGSPVTSRTRTGGADSDDEGFAQDGDECDDGQEGGSCSPGDDGQNRWVGDLPREELEALLVQANRVIQERERDLGIAAAIGQALLEKNMSLRQKHTGIMSRLSTTANLAALAEQSGRQPNSPPTTDYDADSIRDDAVSDMGEMAPPRFEDEDSTPMPTPTVPNSDYFAGLPGSSPASPRASRLDGLFANTSSTSVNTPWQPSEEGLVASTPASPSLGKAYDGPRHYRGRHGHTSSSASQAAAAAAAQAAETQRQLEVLSEQNDNLLSQLADLQTEAEDAKKSGGKRLRRLNKEIEGLRAELDAATRRNDELEGGGAFVDGGLSPLPPRRSPWVRRQRSDEPRLPQPSPSRPGFASQQPHARSELPSQARNSQDGEDDNADAASVHSLGGMSASESVSAQSEVSHTGASLESVLRSGSTSQRRLVAQLLTKIKELEETNMALARAGTEMDGRIGKFLEEGERIRDAYDAVESANQAAMPPSESAQSVATSSDTHGLGGLSPSQLSSSSLAGLSPAARRRRAPGNRYIIEGRRTIRTAMRRESASRSAQDGKPLVNAMPRSVTLESLASSTASSSASSPTSVRMKRMPSGLMRPRILITPSMEDLAARSKHDADEALSSVGESSNGRRRAMERRDSLIPRDAKLMPGIELSSGQPRRDRRRRDSASSFTDGQQSVDASPSMPRSDTASILSRYDSITMHGGHRTLGSELGSVFGDDHDDQDTRGEGINDVEASQLIAWKGNSPQRRASPSSRRLRPMASNNSLRAGSEAESDVADLRWSVGSSATVVPAGLEEDEHDRSQQDYARRHGLIAYGEGMDGEINIDAELLRQLSAQADGEWPLPGEDIIPRGALRDQGITGHEAESYDLIETVTRRRPVHWADDDDYGQPITETEARRLGLMAPKGSLRRGLLGWRAVLGIQSRSSKGKQGDRHERTMSTLGSRTDLAQIESAEQIEERERASEMLRLKRVAALKARVEAGQLSPHKAIALGMRSYDYEDEDREATQRAFAMSPARRRRAMRYEEHDEYNFPASGSGRRLDGGRSPNRTRSSTTSSGTVRGESPRKVRRGTLQRREPDDEDDTELKEQEEESDEQFELLDLDPAKRRPGRRGTDYYPVSFRARYRPTMVKERVKVASGEAVTWATAWMSFSAIMIFAFIVAFTRGPKRILGANQQN